MSDKPLQQSLTQPTVPAVGAPAAAAPSKVGVDAAEPFLLQKKGLLGARKMGGGLGSTLSPTDNYLSPISAKLSGAKQRHFQKGKPLHLASQLSSLAASSTASPAPSDKKSPF